MWESLNALALKEKRSDLVKHHQLQPNIILIMSLYKPTPRSLNSKRDHFIHAALFSHYPRSDSNETIALFLTNRPCDTRMN